MNRKERRTLRKQMSKDATSAIDMMLNVGDKCLTCEKKYDKTNKEMVRTWFVKVFNAQKAVELYCPECYSGKQNGI